LAASVFLDVDIALPVLLMTLVGRVLLDVALPTLLVQVSLARIGNVGIRLIIARRRVAGPLVATVRRRDGWKSLGHDAPPMRRG
jgi:hypothetical protein